MNAPARDVPGHRESAAVERSSVTPAADGQADNGQLRRGRPLLWAGAGAAAVKGDSVLPDRGGGARDQLRGSPEDDLPGSPRVVSANGRQIEVALGERGQEGDLWQQQRRGDSVAEGFLRLLGHPFRNMVMGDLVTERELLGGAVAVLVRGDRDPLAQGGRGAAQALEVLEQHVVADGRREAGGRGPLEAALADDALGGSLRQLSLFGAEG